MIGLQYSGMLCKSSRIRLSPSSSVTCGGINVKVGMVGMEPDKVVSSSCDTMKTAVQTVAVKLFSLLYTCNIRQNECSHLFFSGGARHGCPD